MTRIVAGSAGGRRLRVPPGDTTRPTSDRVREALFSALDAAGAVQDARVLDLYAGSGALGLEAASRGAREVVLVEVGGGGGGGGRGPPPPPRPPRAGRGALRPPALPPAPPAAGG
ncbi:RsmD family RNA methyltransferase, partial [Kineococcus arenarius]|uniref:RsmD family RNA methyltransferase n=1 Tax=Kineococcus sp. SYSU DK020 TaxID=3383141 RepID=UPI003D7C8492